MTPMDVQRKTHSAKEGFGITWCRTIHTSLASVIQAVWPGPTVGGNLEDVSLDGVQGMVKPLSITSV